MKSKPEKPTPLWRRDFTVNWLVLIAILVFAAGFIVYGATRTAVETARFLLPMLAVFLVLVSARVRVDRLDLMANDTMRQVDQIGDEMVDKDDLERLVHRFQNHLEDLRARVEAIEAKLAAGGAYAAASVGHEAAPDETPGPLRRQAGASEGPAGPAGLSDGALAVGGAAHPAAERPRVAPPAAEEPPRPGAHL